MALLMVALLGFAAISIDVGKLYWEKAQLQNGADAGALALASICGRDSNDPLCSPSSEIVRDLANDNSNDNESNVYSVDIKSNEVTVNTTASEVGAPANSVSVWFAQILDPSFASAEVGASATAGWGAPTALSAKFPVTFSKCEIATAPVGPTGLQFFLAHKKNDKCDGPQSGLNIPGGFGWLEQNGKTCSAATRVGQWIGSSTGNSYNKTGCNDQLLKWKEKLVKGEKVIILLPVFDGHGTSGGGSGGSYFISGYAAVEIQGWMFKNNDSLLDFQANSDAKSIRGKGGSEVGFIGQFLRFVFDDEDVEFGSGGPNYGADVIRLTK
ncbi:hypothetical protein JOF47_000357 [Paeniglutamicibacter kerguelensis]|uniref:Putative Flp pilus-assembly TadG-like N-terminal domain-containing protein n=1 Tax=Paeniglutamicibacter kerguelensis TaxID=254788 RepID=A0ABS4X8Q1_9MICC|nr:hypothetical protein [Paeniglutamicibacter kerguelensis]